jgi:hypothetical protein
VAAAKRLLDDAKARGFAFARIASGRILGTQLV